LGEKPRFSHSPSHLQWHFPKPEAKLEAKARSFIFTETLENRPTSFSFELCKYLSKISLEHEVRHLASYGVHRIPETLSDNSPQYVEELFDKGVPIKNWWKKGKIE